MQDKTKLGISDLLRQFIEALVEEVVVEGKPFDDQKKKWLQQYGQKEGVDYATLEKNLTAFFKTIEELKSKESTSNERLVKVLAKDCYLEKCKTEKLIEGVTRQQQESSDILAALDDMRQLLQDCLDKTKNQDPPTVIHGYSNWATDFIEQICQAYCNKNIGFLEDAFSQDVQIITGAFVKSKTDIRYRTQGKQQYFANLKYIFRRNKTIDVRFETDSSTGIFYSSADGKCLGYRLLQRWKSDNYSDSGYLYLVLYAGQNGPKVIVRAWSPK